MILVKSRWVTVLVPWAAVLVAVAVVVGAWSSGVQLRVVRSGSMSPTIQVGDIVVSHKVDVAAIHPGEVVLFNDPVVHGSSVAHRVVKTAAADGVITVTTKGDANKITETWSVPQTTKVGREVALVPNVGLFYLTPFAWVSILGLLLFALSIVLIAHVLNLPIHHLLGRPRRRRRVHRLRRRHLRQLLRRSTLGIVCGIAVLASSSTYGAWTAADANALNTFTTPANFPIVFSSCSGTAQTTTVPAGKTLASVVVTAAAGAASGSGTGGNGAVLTASFAVSVGQVINIFVGCKGAVNAAGAGYSAGGAGGTGSSGANGGGGGGASAVCIGTCATGTVQVVAGAGGGGGNNGGAGGAGGTVSSGATGSPVGTAYDGLAGAAALSTAGAAGTHASAPPTAGTVGGNGAQGCFYDPGIGGGGGGGGYNGGKGGGGLNGGCVPISGGAAGGGAGSSWYRTGDTFTSIAATNTGAGQVAITLT